MTQTISKGVKALVAEALESVPSITAEEAMELVGTGSHVFVDLRDGTEQAKTGIISGAVASSRGMLEFHIDPDSPIHKAEFSEGTEFIFYCASGGRSALAAKAAAEMGLGPIRNLTGGFAAWQKAGGPVGDED